MTMHLLYAFAVFVGVVLVVVIIGIAVLGND